MHSRTKKTRFDCPFFLGNWSRLASQRFDPSPVFIPVLSSSLTYLTPSFFSRRFFKLDGIQVDRRHLLIDGQHDRFGVIIALMAVAAETVDTCLCACEGLAVPEA